jgi:epoxyqueuosine reductase
MTVRTGSTDWSRLKEEIRENASRLGIDKIGFASADPFLEMKERLQEHRAKGYESGFEEPDLDKRVDPALSLPQPRSILSIAVAYPSRLPEGSPRSRRGAYRGQLSRSAWGRDYHEVLRERMRRLEAFIRERVPDARIESMVDTGALVDRAVAERAGIGWSGKNCATITPEWGSWVYLGEMITDLPFPPDTPVANQCGDCTLCIDACPTGALVGPGELNASRCLSYVTQTKGMVEDWLKPLIGNRLYGCDTCQIVCPKNKERNWTHQPELQPDPEQARPLLIPLLSMGNKEFKERFGASSAAWRGKKPIQRNAVIALGNYRDESAVPALKDVLANDPRPVLRGTAAWALGQIGGSEALEAIRSALEREQDPEAGEEMKRAYDKLVSQ